MRTCVAEIATRWLVSAAGAMLIGCGADASSSAQLDVPTAGLAMETATGADPGISSAAGCRPEHPASAPLRRLTRVEYNNTVRDLLGDTSAPANGFPPDEISGVFGNDARVLSVTPRLAEQYMLAAEALAANAVRDLPRLTGCDPAAIGEQACARLFVERFGRRAYRRPLDASELDRLLELYAAARAQDDFAWGIEVVVQAVLQSPRFLYRFEPGATPAAGDELARLTGYELATRLSYLLWATMPDEALSAAAESGQLASAAQVGQMTRRMLDDPRARPAIDEFYREWLGLDALVSVYKDAKVYPEFDDTLRAELGAEVPAFVEHVLWDDDAKLTTLLTANLVSSQGSLAGFYGVAPSETEAAPLALADPNERAGILTLGSVLAVYGLPNQSSPVQRGKLVRERLLCQSLPPPPAGLMVTAPEVDSSRSTSERFAEHRENPACASCHALMDPLGLGFEAYDGVGHHRATDGGRAVDDSGTIAGTSDIDGAFHGVRELVSALARSADVRRCLGVQWFRYAFGRGEEAADQCALEGIDRVFEQSGGDLRELIVALTTSDDFLYRRVVAGEAP